MQLILHVWRQKDAADMGKMVEYRTPPINPDMSFLEMLDVVNEELIAAGKDPIAFDHDCREGICGSCAMVINGRPHGGQRATTTCQLHMRHYADGDHIYVEPWRAKSFPVLKDLMVDRSSFDRIINAGGYVSVNTGGAPDANLIPIGKPDADAAFEAAACIACGACVAACKNASAMLFVSAKVAQFVHLPQGAPERNHRAKAMVKAMDDEGFGNCSNQQECEAACPKLISWDNIGVLNREFLRAATFG